ncbi:MAG: carboxylesterase family protein [Pirellulales bacterium]|nr:carboxylesterase family protein [Pirellulales bacterium]
MMRCPARAAFPLMLGLAVLLLGAPALAQSSAAKTADKDAKGPAVLKVAANTVDTESGKVRGLVQGEAEDVHCYKGIPFAAPPVGELRWREPQPPVAWTGVRECYEFGPCCTQKASPFLTQMPGMALSAPQSEDCLYLNVWTPAKRSEQPLPVMVWIHGGGYIWGAGSQPVYEGSDLARRGVIAVTINYRLGHLGFLAHPALSAESEHKVSGNYGILDQIAALRWVQKNIANFGGDPQQVTIYGESAGGGSVFTLIASPLAAGLFQRAIAESGPSLTMAGLKQKRYGHLPAEEAGLLAAKTLGVENSGDALQALRALPVDEIISKTSSMEGSGEFSIRGNVLSIAPVVDGYVLPDDPMKLYAAGKVNAVPLIVGANKDEATLFTMFAPLPKSIEAMGKIVDTEFGPLAGKIKELYPAAKQAEIRRAVVDLAGDVIFLAPARYVARSVAKAGASVFTYNFAHRPPAPTGPMFGAHHGAEIPYALDNIEIATGARESDIKVRDLMTGYWVQFAKTGNPNFEGAPAWPTVTASEDPVLIISDAPEVSQGFRGSQLDAIDEFMTMWGKE